MSGRPIYQRTYTATIGTPTSLFVAATVNHGISGFSSLVATTGSFYTPVGVAGATYPVWGALPYTFPQMDGPNTTVVDYWVSATQIIFVAADGYTGMQCTVTLQYTR
jgi:hypothetical protein